jgi:copper chaperone CopZ
MEASKISSKAAYAGILTAITASICCLTPILALIAGTSGIASTFSWIEPLRPYLIGLTILVLVFAWYQKLKPKSQYEKDCACEDDENASFWQSKKFLLFVTLFAGLMLAFPYYSGNFYAQPTKEIVYVQKDNIAEETFMVEGMTCAGCENHIQSEVNKLEGIISVKASYENGNTIVKYDRTKVLNQQIVEAINSTGYKVIENDGK